MAMVDITKYQIGEPAVILRSELHEADYNPRRISDEAKKTLKQGIKKIGLTGGIVVNARTGNTLVSGHQRIAVLDDLQKYDAATGNNDYKLRVDLIDVDLKNEKTLAILLNNPNAQGDWDYDKLKIVVNEVDYKVAGLTDADLSMIGVDFLYKTEAENDIVSDFGDMMGGLEQKHKEEVAQRKAERAELRQAMSEAQANEPTWDEKVQHMKDVKAQVKEQAMERAANNDAYVVLSFDNYDNKLEFLEFFGLADDSKFIKGETIMKLLDSDGMEEDE